MRELLIYSLLPVLLIGAYIYKKDKNKEPKEIIKKLLIGGVFSVIIVVIVTSVLGNFIDIYAKEYNNLNNLELVIYCYIVVALTEESSKIFMLYKIGYKSKYYDEPYDMLLYGGFIGLGFAALENILYVVSEGVITAIVRAFTAVPFHAMLGVIMGYYLNRYHQTNNKTNIILSLLIPVLLHGTYDYYAISSQLQNTNYFLNIAVIIGGLLVVLIFVVKILNSTSKESKQEKENTNILIENYTEDYCPNCGTKYELNFCKNCGRRRR